MRLSLPWIVLRVVALLGAALFCTVSLRWHNPLAVNLPLAPFVAAAGACLLVPSLRRALEGARKSMERSSWRLMLALASGHFLGAVAICHWVFADVPNIEDGNAYYLQAKLFAQGRTWVPDEGADFFVFPWMVRRGGRLFSMFPPGFALLAAPGFWIGAPMLMPPLFGALGVVAAWAFVREVAGRARANAVAALCAASPWSLVMSASYMSHSAMLACTYGCGYFMLRAIRASRRGLRSGRPGFYAGSAVAAGLLAGLGFLVRPAEGAAVGVAFAAYALWSARARAVPPLLLAAALAALGPVAFFAHNRALIGGWGRDLLSALDPPMRYGFGPDIGAVWPDTFPKVGHTLGRAMLNANFNLSVLSSEAFGWPIASSTFALIALFFGRRRRAWWAAVLPCALIAAAYLGYWYHGVCIGARFYYGMLPPLAMLTLEGVALSVRAVERLTEARRTPLQSMAFALLAVMSLGALALYLPRTLAVGPYAFSRGFRSRLLADADALPPGPALVFIRGSDRHGATLILRNEWPLARGPVIFAHDAGPVANQSLSERYPGRRVRYLEFAWPRNPIAEALRLRSLDGLASP